MSRLLHIRCLAAALGALAVAALPITLAAAAIVRAPAFTPGSRYLALGDSVTFGFEEATVRPAPNYHRAASFLGYPEHIAQAFHAVVTNPACPGETSASLISVKAASNGCENILGKPGGYRTTFPLHVHYAGSQLAFAVRYLKAHRDTKLVSLMIGANDLFLCEATTRDACTSAAEQRATFTAVAKNVRHILTDLRRTAHYAGQLVILNYYSLDYTSRLVDTAVIGLNRAVDAAARPFGVEIADGYGEYLADARKFGDRTCTAGLITRTSPAGSCGVHPTFAGQALLAESVLKAARL